MFDILSRYRTPLLVTCLVLAALLLYSANLRRGERTNLFERAVILVTSPLQAAVDGAISGVADLWGHYLWLVDTEEANEGLNQENRRLRADLDRMEEVVLENERLRKLLEFKETIDLPALPAEVIAEDTSSWFRTVVIDKGSRDGVREGMPVVVAEGAVGRVIRTSLGQSRVLLITDASSAVAALVQDSRTRGVCRGLGDVLTFDFALRQRDIAIGDRIVTSGTGGVFPKGLVLGSVSRVTREQYGLFQAVQVTPSVDFSRLEEVLVLLTEEAP